MNDGTNKFIVVNKYGFLRPGNHLFIIPAAFYDDKNIKMGHSILQNIFLKKLFFKITIFFILRNINILARVFNFPKVGQKKDNVALDTFLDSANVSSY